MSLQLQYASLKNYLFAIAYNMTGEVQEAEDIVHDAFEDVLRKDQADIRNAKSFFTRIVLNKAIDRLAVLKKQREQYPATWLPVPDISDTDTSRESDILPYVFLHLMEELNPLERAVFILREAFDYEYEDIAALCGITTDNCRQLLHRARAKVKEPKVPTSAASKDASEKLLQEFLEACLQRDASRLSALLKEDVVLYSDGGGKVVAARRILEGISSIAKFIFGVVRKTMDNWSAAKKIFVNGEPALLMPDKDGVYLVLIPYIADGKVVRIFMMRNPDKIILRNPVTKAIA